MEIFAWRLENSLMKIGEHQRPAPGGEGGGGGEGRNTWKTTQTPVSRPFAIGLIKTRRLLPFRTLSLFVILETNSIILLVGLASFFNPVAVLHTLLLWTHAEEIKQPWNLRYFVNYLYLEAVGVGYEMLFDIVIVSRSLHLRQLYPIRQLLLLNCACSCDVAGTIKESDCK